MKWLGTGFGRTWSECWRATWESHRSDSRASVPRWTLKKTARTFTAQQILQIFFSLKIVYRTNCDMVISETLGFARSLRQNATPWLCRCKRGPWSASSWLCKKMKSIICVARSTRGFLWATISTISGLNWAVGTGTPKCESRCVFKNYAS